MLAYSHGQPVSCAVHQTSSLLSFPEQQRRHISENYVDSTLSLHQPSLPLTMAGEVLRASLPWARGLIAIQTEGAHRTTSPQYKCIP